VNLCQEVKGAGEIGWIGLEETGVGVSVDGVLVIVLIDTCDGFSQC
jgi:hypothetical protein